MHAGVCARPVPAYPFAPHVQLHHLPASAAQERPDTDMRGEEISERRAIVNARRQRRGLDHRVLASEAGVVMNARDTEVVASSKLSPVERARCLQSARQQPRANRARNGYESRSRGAPR
jgi:hypothetical protein